MTLLRTRPRDVTPPGWEPQEPEERAAAGVDDPHLRYDRLEMVQGPADAQADKARLEHRLHGSTSLAILAREARALGYVRPGERLYIVKGIPQWRHQLRRAEQHR